MGVCLWLLWYYLLHLLTRSQDIIYIHTSNFRGHTAYDWYGHKLLEACIDGISMGVWELLLLRMSWVIHELRFETFCLTIGFVDPFQRPTVAQFYSLSSQKRCPECLMNLLPATFVSSFCILSLTIYVLCCFLLLISTQSACYKPFSSHLIPGSSTPHWMRRRRSSVAVKRINSF